MEKPLSLLPYLRKAAGISLLGAGVWAVQKRGFMHRAFQGNFQAAVYSQKGRVYPRDKVDESGVHFLLQNLYCIL